ncbi:hypothetical protein MMC17_007251 [Xylographa soralifera]|nr:hypothetical protein [Xylographa soralifera]
MLDIDEAFIVDGAVLLLYAGSATRAVDGFYRRIFKEHMEAREDSSTFHYIAWNASNSYKFVEIVKAAPKDPAALIRTAKAVVIACLHTHTEVDYSQLLKHNGIVDFETNP